VDKTDREKKPQAKPREPKLEPIPRSLVNNWDVPLVVLFRQKFRSLFSGTAELGPQDVEEGVSVEGELEGKLEEFVMRICTLIGNRRKNVEYVPLSVLDPALWGSGDLWGSGWGLIVVMRVWGRCCRRRLIQVLKSMDSERTERINPPCQT
jgi:hypothetical protein